jgi:hypothetical protein
MKSMMRFVLAVFVSTAAAKDDPVREAFDHLYNFEFAAAHRVLDAYRKASPYDPMGPATRAATYLFYELDRLKILQSDFFQDDKKISGDERLEPDPAIRTRFMEAVDETQRLAQMRLRIDPSETRSLFAFSMTEGLRTDYTAFVEKKQLRSLRSARQAHNYAVEVLRRDPTFVDAYLATGITEYMVGSLPFFIRWFVKFDNTQGSKQQAVINLEKVAATGRYMGPFARILLSIIHLREKRPARSLELLEGLGRDFPRNPLLVAERDNLRRKLARGR